MKIHLTRPIAGELDAELLALGVIIASGAAGFAWLALAVPTPVCLFHAATGIPCPTCGGTRCIRNLVSGHFGTALAWNPLVFFSVMTGAAYGIYAGAVTLLRLPRVRFENVPKNLARAIRLIIIFAIAANWIYLVLRFSHGA